MEQTFISLFFSWFPILALIVVWIVFMRRHRGTQAAYMDCMKKQVEQVERMAVAVERLAEAIEKRSHS